MQQNCDSSNCDNKSLFSSYPLTTFGLFPPVSSLQHGCVFKSTSGLEYRKHCVTMNISTYYLPVFLNYVSFQTTDASCKQFSTEPCRLCSSGVKLKVRIEVFFKILKVMMIWRPVLKNVNYLSCCLFFAVCMCLVIYQWHNSL